MAILPRKSTTAGDVLMVIAIVLPVSVLVGAILGLYGKQLGLSGGLRTLIIVAFVSVASRFATKLVQRRQKARAAAMTSSGVK
ncbi:MAG TPA: hypothetical protein VKB50_23100 [Vicinamibacterales bacterium]|nr:hypothetical protein [Vicinamibacterales bacterium]